MTTVAAKTSENNATPRSEREIAEIIRDIASQSLELSSLELQLLRTEVMENVAAEIIFTRRLIIGSALSVIGLTMLLVALVFALAPYVHPWIIALIIGAFLLVAGWSTIFFSWRHHKALEQIKAELEADITQALKFSLPK